MTNKFVASAVEVDKDTDVLVEDILSMGTEGIAYFADEAVKRHLLQQDNNEVFVIADAAGMDMAENVAAALNAEYVSELEKEMELMAAKNEVKASIVVEEETVESKEIDNAAVIARSAAAKKFLEGNAAKLANAKKGPVAAKVEEKKEEKTMGNRKRLMAGAGVSQTKTNVKEEEVANVETKVEETKSGVGARRRLAAGVGVNTTSRKGAKKEDTTVKGSRKKLKRSASANSNGYVKFEGPWYLNQSLYPVLGRLEQILDNMEAEVMVDEELSIQEIRIVEPQDIRKYENREDILIVIQVLSNGVVTEFPIKEVGYENSTSDLSSASIGWIDTRNGKRPSFGFWRPNALELEFECCGTKFVANSGNVYCPKCRTRHANVEIDASHNLEFGFNNEWTFQTIPNMSMPREILSLVMAIAQYDQELDMHGVIEE